MHLQIFTLPYNEYLTLNNLNNAQYLITYNAILYTTLQQYRLIPIRDEINAKNLLVTQK